MQTEKIIVTSSGEGLDEALEAFTDLKISFVLNSMVGTRVKKEYVGGTFKFSLL